VDGTDSCLMVELGISGVALSDDATTVLDVHIY
jgi:hypothetical protein